MFIRHLALAAAVSFASHFALAGTPAAAAATTTVTQGAYAVQTCSLQSSLQIIQDNQGDLSIQDLLQTGTDCESARTVSPKPGPKEGQEASESLTADEKKNASTVTAACSAAIQGSGAHRRCPSFMGQTASQFKKNIDELTQQLNEAQNKSIESEKNFQQQQQDLTRQGQAENTKLISGLPTQKKIDVSTANQKYLDQQAEANKAYTALQNQYTDAQATYANTQSSIKSQCFAQATAEYNAQKQAIEKAKAGSNGVNISSSRVVAAQNALKTYQSRKYNECLQNVSGTQAATQAANNLANKKQQLEQQVNDLNIQRANLRNQLNTALSQIDAKYNADVYATQTTIRQLSDNLTQLNSTHAAELQHNRQVVDDLGKQIAQAQQVVSCVEAQIGTVPKEATDTSDQQKAYSNAKNLVMSCKDRDGAAKSDVSDICKDVCSQVSGISPSLVTAIYDHTATSGYNKKASANSSASSRVPASGSYSAPKVSNSKPTAGSTGSGN